jgi:hypothetical protein
METIALRTHDCQPIVDLVNSQLQIDPEWPKACLEDIHKLVVRFLELDQEVIRLKPETTVLGATECRVLLDPSEALLELMTAVRACKLKFGVPVDAHDPSLSMAVVLS